MITDYSQIFQIDKEHWAQFNSKLIRTTILKNDFFITKGQLCQYVGFIEQGAMRTYYMDSKGNDVSFLFHLDHDFFTDYESILTGKSSSLYIQALENTKVMLMHKNTLEELYQSSMYWQKFGRNMSERIYIAAKRRIEDLLYLTAESRYLRMIDEQPQIFQKVPLKYIASYMGVKPQSLSRIRNRLSKH